MKLKTFCSTLCSLWGKKEGGDTHVTVQKRQMVIGYALKGQRVAGSNLSKFDLLVLDSEKKNTAGAGATNSK